eukprot:GFKZ01008134.1.p1 GENE.GFKZ01008134.1~~GFKZ01008134.1.p1  ORF type:complete len:354 (+),score=74.21 GFKZ01008134.1:536-1597(+)
MAAEFKDKGNDAYKAGDFAKAVEFYTLGIEQEPSNAALFSNRSAAYLKMEAYGNARRDAEMCIELDASWSKGWWRKGTAQFEDKDYYAARATFQEGLNHCPGDENLLAGVEKATKFLKAMESVQGPGAGEKEFDPDAPSQRTTENKTTEEEESPRKEDEGNTFPGSPEHEIERIKSAPNHYAVLHVSTDADNGKLKKNYYTLARMLHPDKCQLDGAEDAMTSVSQAYDTLTNVVKKTLYDQFLSQTGGDGDHPNQTYQEWESRQQPVELPKWLAALLSIKGCGWILALVVIVVLLPVILVFLVIYLIFFIMCLPFRLGMRVCFPERWEAMREEAEKQRAKVEEEAQDRYFAHV